MTTFNGEKFIREQLTSLSSQTGVELDLFVFDDCSTDSTLDIINEFQQSLNIKVRPNDTNSGGTGLNILSNMAKLADDEISQYQYFALCDQDDVWLPTKLERATSQLEATSTDLYFSNLLLWNNSQGVFGEIKKNAPMRKYDYLFEGGSAGCTYVFSLELLQHIRSVLGKLPLGNGKRVSHDWLIYFLARYGKFNVCIDDESFIWYRIHESNQYGNSSGFSLENIRAKFKMLRSGFVLQQIENSSYFLSPNDIESKIYSDYLTSFWSRLMVFVKYNSSLMRKSSKLLVFMLISMLFVSYKSRNRLNHKTG